VTATLPRGGLSVASVEEIRAAFPSLLRRHEGHPVSYFDGPGGTQVPQGVADAVTDYLLRHNANTHWDYPTSHETDAALLRAREALADYVNGAPDEIVFGANMTTLTFHVGRALGRGTLKPGDEVVLTELDHHANSDTWRALAAERGLAVKVVRLRPETGQLDAEDLERAITPRTRLLAIGAASNALGTINDVPAIARRAKAAGALVFVDAVHYAAHQPPDVVALGCDMLACSAYKFYGPHVGVLWIRRELHAALDAPKLRPADDLPPEKLETGTLNHEGIVGAGAAVEFLASLAGDAGTRRERLLRTADALHHRGAELLLRLWDGLRAQPRVTLFGPPPGSARTPTLSFVVANAPSREVARALARRGVFLSHGDFYATSVAERLGHAADGLVRAGCAAYTTAGEIDRLVDGVRALG
jgi:cysteine desulfurase family protein (TIGR01976 family)